MQVVAWRAEATEPDLLLNISRFSLSQILMNGNVFVFVAPGGYDTVIVLRYEKGQPRVVLSESTHDIIRIFTTSKAVTVEFDSADDSPVSKHVFSVDEHELQPGTPEDRK